MLKLGIELKEVDEKLNINLIDPTKKQLQTATENEKVVAQVVKNILDKKLIQLITENTDEEEKEAELEVKIKN